MIGEVGSAQASRRSLTSGMSSSFSANDSGQYSVHSTLENVSYRGEGNANLVVALHSERKVLRFRKCLSRSTDESKQQQQQQQQVRYNNGEDLRRVRREAEFIKHVISGLLGSYVRVPEILRCEGSEIARLVEKIHSQRPEHRRAKEIVREYATKYPDYTLLPDHLSYFSTKPTYCVEIKPKQGYICKADRLFKKCPYCLMQYYKLQNGAIQKCSDYCPLDLFSGEPDRMDRALKALLHSLQNNLKIFKDGEVVLDETRPEGLQSVLSDWFTGSEEDQMGSFLELVRTALIRPFDSKNNSEIENRRRERGETVIMPLEVNIPTTLKPETVKTLSSLLSSEKECELSLEQQFINTLTQGSVLERILRMQQLHCCGYDVVAWLTAKYSSQLNDQLIYEDLLVNGSSTSVNQNKVNSNPDEIECKKIEQLYNEKLSNFFTLENSIKIIGNYLLFCTARDCSISMAFQEVNRISLRQIDPKDTITLSNGHSYLVALRVLDLDMKSLSHIARHCQRNNNVVEACIKCIDSNNKKVMKERDSDNCKKIVI